MSYFQRIKSFLAGVFIFLFAVLLLLIPENAYVVVAAVLSLSLLIYGFKLLFYYIKMARHMVGGKSILFQAILVLDLALFAMSLMNLGSLYIMFYLIGIYAFTGAIDILRALEQKKLSAPFWKFKLISGVLSLVFVVIIVTISIITQSTEIMVYGYCLSLSYSAVMRIISAFRKTSVIYIQ